MIESDLKLIPHKPGSYQMYNKDDVIIYVGKAKDLKKRVSSYFNRTQTGKTKKLVSEIKYFKYIVTTTEEEAFILELNLIKNYNPKYNILLRDDKSYPYIEYIKKPYPRLKISRYLRLKKRKDKLLFGPYPNQGAARKMVNLLNRIYPLKKCSGNPKSLCLYYHIGQCLGYCVKNIDENQINKMEAEILSFLRGNDKILKEKITEKMNNASENLNFEAALEFKNDLEYIDILMQKQKVELSDPINRDVINYYVYNGYISLNIFFLRGGKLVGNKNKIYPITDDYLSEVETFIAQFYLKNEIPKEIIVPDEINITLLSKTIDTKVLHALKGKKKKLLELVKENSKISLENKFESIKRDERRTIKAQDELRKILNMDTLYRIDIFDNSNLFGDYTVSAMVVFKDGVPSKNDYRKFKISIDKNDDYAAMREVMYRRYQRMLVERTEKPDLIIVDGGEKQINAAKEIINLLRADIKVVGLKKDDTHSTSVLVDEDLNSIKIDKASDVFHFLARMQDEVHRFTINYHRNLRSKGSISSILDNIEGIGNNRKVKLLKRFKSLKGLNSATLDELKELLPEKVATNLKEYLSNYFENKEVKKWIQTERK